MFCKNFKKILIMLVSPYLSNFLSISWSEISSETFWSLYFLLFSGSSGIVLKYLSPYRLVVKIPLIYFAAST